MKKILFLICTMFFLLSLSACGSGSGGSYSCKDCSKTTSKAYYDMSSSKESVMCEDCARKYWMPLDYKTYRVK